MWLEPAEPSALKGQPHEILFHKGIVLAEYCSGTSGAISLEGDGLMRIFFSFFINE
jgi:hypothetical protein